MSEAASTSNIVLFESSDGEVRLDVAVDVGKDEIWLNRSQMSLLFDRDVKTIGKHIANALKEELEQLIGEGREKEAKELFREQLTARPDLLLPGSDVKGELQALYGRLLG